MSEDAIGTGGEKLSVSRRDFLKLLGIGGASVVTAHLGLDNIDTLEEKAAQFKLSEKMKNGAFNPDQVGDVPTFEKMKNEIKNRTEFLTGVSAAGLYVSDVDNNAHILVGDYSDKFVPGSLIKIPLLYQIWLRGEKDGKEYLTKEATDRILGASEHSGDFLMGLPFNKDRKPEELKQIVTELLEESGIKPEFDSEGNISVSHSDYFGFLRKTELPPIMKEAMKQTEEDDMANYGISKVLRLNSKGSDDIYFKIGLARQGKEVINSYAIIMGDNVKAVGYAKGEGIQDVHEQMLYAAAAIAKVSSG